MSQRRTKRADGRYIVNVTVDEPDGPSAGCTSTGDRR